MTKELTDLSKRIQSWPEMAREELFRIVDEIENELSGEYHPTPAELSGIDRGLADADAGRFASDEAVDRVMRKFRAG